MTQTRIKAKQATYKSDATGAAVRNLHDKLSDTVSVKDFGAVGDGVTDDTAAIQAAIDAVSAAGGGTVYFPTPATEYRLEASILVPVKVHLVGEGNTKIAARTGTYINNYVFLFNTTNGTTWIISYPNLEAPSMTGIHIDSEDLSYMAVAFAGSSRFERCRFRYFAKSLVGSADYNDTILIRKCWFSNYSNPATYQVDLANTGDCSIIEQCQFENVGNTPDTPLNSIKIANNNLITINNCLVGNIDIASCSATASIVNTGADGGRWVFTDSNVSIRDCALSSLESLSALEFINTSEFGSTAVMDNVLISHDMQRDEYKPYAYDVKVHNNCTLSIRDSYKRIVLNSAPQNRYLFGLNIQNESNASITNFNRYSYLLSQSSLITDENVTNTNVSHSVSSAVFNCLTSAFSTASVAWGAASDTYYYKCILLWDNGRLFGRSDSAAEVSIAATNGGNAVGLAVDASSYTPQLMIRVYRGTSTGSYDKYVDIPIVDSPTLLDDGDYLSGRAWITRAASGVDTYNNYTSDGFKLSGNNIQFRANGAPTAGTWLVGDTVLDFTPTVDGNNMLSYGWFCTATGTPGTWVPMYVSTVSPAT